MKTFLSAVIIVVVIGITVAVLGVSRRFGPSTPLATVPVTPDTTTAPSANDSDDTALSPSASGMEMCYIWNTEAGDKAALSMNIEGGDVTGEFDWLPAEKDQKTGSFAGIVSDTDPVTMKRTANVIWNTNAEGMQTPEELKIIFDDSTASPGFGTMKDRGDGTYIYADEGAVDYSLNLQETNCGDTAD